MKSTRNFAHPAESVTSARRFATGLLEGVPDDVLEAIALMTSELASNCIRHTDSGFELTVTQTAAEIRVQATDLGGGEPTMRTPAPTDPSGRGLQIIDMFSDAWGYENHAGEGKTVWFTVAVRTPAAATVPGS